MPATVNWAYTTVKTMLDRLVEKEAVGKSKRGNIGLYEPLISRRQARRTALKIVLNQAFDGAFGPLMHFLVEDEKLSGKEKRQCPPRTDEHCRARCACCVSGPRSMSRRTRGHPPIVSG